MKAFENKVEKGENAAYQLVSHNVFYIVLNKFLILESHF
jgi:hypothetical protein